VPEAVRGLALLGVTGQLSSRLTAGGDWSLAFEPPRYVKFNAVRRGSCHLTVEGSPDPIPLAEGDCYLLTRPLAFSLSSDPSLTPAPAASVFATAKNGTAHAGTGTDVLLLGGRFDFGPRARTLLLDALPPVVHVPGDSEAAGALHWSLEQIDAELHGHPVASGLVAGHLALVMLIHVLRRHLAQKGLRPGLLAGLADPVTAAALRALHTSPAHPWSVRELADASRVSRSTLAARFRRTVGQAPLEYLTRWRIELATDRLRRGDGTLATIARDVGYGSESALSTAFKRVTGTSPTTMRLSRHDEALPPR
jgi:AraC-like DNA-binding protein